jgi:hypothetical protein
VRGVGTANVWIVWAGSPTTQRSRPWPRHNEQPLLQGTHVLVFVEQQVPVGETDLGGDVIVLDQQGGAAQQDVGEVDATAVAFDLLVGRQHPGHLLGVE